MTLAGETSFGAIGPRRSMLQRVWPFGARGVLHESFGRLKPWRNGNYLRGRVNFAPLGRPIWVVIRAIGDHPAPQQEKVFAQIEKHYTALAGKVFKRLLAEYERVRAAQPAVTWPAVACAAELSRIIPLDAIWLELGDGHPFVFSYQSELDKDHEFHLFFRHGKLDHVAFEH